MKKIYLSLIGIVLIIFMVSLIGIDKIIDAINHSNHHYIILAIIVNLICLVIRSFRWGFIICKLNDFKDNFIVKMIGLFAANITPIRSGGEVFTAVAGKKVNGISLANGLSAGFIERMFDGVIAFLLLFSCNFLISDSNLSSSNQTILIMGTLCSLGFLVFVYLFNWKEGFNVYIYNIIHSIIKFLPISKNFLDRIYSKMTFGLNDMVKYSKEFSTGKNLIGVFLLSLIPWLMECLRLYLILLAFNIHIHFMVVIFIFFMADIIGIVSMLPGGMGSFELVVTKLLTLPPYDVSFTIAGTVILVDRLISYWLINLVGIIFTLHYTKDIFESLKNN
ncbi:MAG: flippase-like domain-containing protein [Methanobrevibacter sp.]|jgi:uncharacterized protein (TIRG00374 family)|nr:flippase-like domain-containing protein [Methanobrevibacter sp.]